MTGLSQFRQEAKRNAVELLWFEVIHTDLFHLYYFSDIPRIVHITPKMLEVYGHTTMDMPNLI